MGDSLAFLAATSASLMVRQFSWHENNACCGSDIRPDQPQDLWISKTYVVGAYIAARHTAPLQVPLLLQVIPSAGIRFESVGHNHGGLGFDLAGVFWLLLLFEELWKIEAIGVSEPASGVKNAHRNIREARPTAPATA